jgi:hypothetical protein
MLSVTLEASFTDGGFDLAATLDGVTSSVVNADFGEVQFDASEVLDLAAALAPPELTAVLDAAASIASVTGVAAGALASPDELLAPLRVVLEPLDLAAAINLDDLAGALTGGQGLTALEGRIDAVAGALGTGPLADLVQLAGLRLPGISLSNTLAAVGGPFGGVISLATLLAGLMATEAITAKVLRQAGLLDRVLDFDVAHDAGVRLERLAGRAELVTSIRSLDPDDPVAVEMYAAPVIEFLRTVHEVRDTWSQGLGFGEATLLGLDVVGCTAGLESAKLILSERALAPIRELAAQLRALVDPVLAATLPDPSSALGSAVAEGLTVLIDLEGSVRSFDAAGAVNLVTGGLDSILEPVAAIADAVESVGTVVASAIRSIRDLVDGIDLTPVTDTFETILDPINTTLDAIEQAIGVAQEPIETVAGAVGAVLDEVRGVIEDAADIISTALGRVSVSLEAVDIAAVQAAIEAGLGGVTDLLDAAELTPYFDASVGAIDTATGVIDAVPFGMLPTDVQQEVVDAVRPIKRIDFDAIADGLRAELTAIMDALDTDVLDEVDAAYRAVIAFLESIDPNAAIAEFEAGPFEEFHQSVLAVDPAAVLEPVDAVLDDVRGLLTGVDATAIIAPIQGVFDGLLAELDALNPATLLEPLRDEVDAVRARIEETLQLSMWSDHVTTARDAVVDLLDRIDPASMSAAFSTTVVEALKAQLEDVEAPAGALITGLAQAAGLDAEAGAWRAVRSWFEDVDGRSSVEHRLALAAGLTAQVEVKVEALDPAPLIAVAQRHYRAVSDAVAGHPADSALRRTLDPLLAAAVPANVLGPLIENRARLQAKLAVDAGALAAASMKGRSEITAITDGLRDALMPLASIPVWLRNLVGRFGIDDPEQPLSGILQRLLEAAGPDRLLPPLTGLLMAIRDKAKEVVDAAFAPATDLVGTVESMVAAVDLGPIIDEVSGLHGDVVTQVGSLSPEVLLGDTLAAFDGVVARVEAFDPLAPVRAVIDDLQATIESTFETLTPSILFRAVGDAYDTIVDLAAGLDVKGLLEPVLDALAGIAGQLDGGLEMTADALGRLQAALPGEVTSSSASGSVSVDVGVSL